VELDGITFDSKGEAARYQELRLLEQAGEIADLRVHTRWELQPGWRDSTGKWWRPITYESDFDYMEGDEFVVEDFKGMKTQVFKLKEKLFRFLYPEFTFRITAAKGK
jgi:hypothetical protein